MLLGRGVVLASVVAMRLDQATLLLLGPGAARMPRCEARLLRLRDELVVVGAHLIVSRCQAVLVHILVGRGLRDSLERAVDRESRDLDIGGIGAGSVALAVLSTRSNVRDEALALLLDSLAEGTRRVRGHWRGLIAELLKVADALAQLLIVLFVRHGPLGHLFYFGRFGWATHGVQLRRVCRLVL